MIIFNALQSLIVGNIVASLFVPIYSRGVTIKIQPKSTTVFFSDYAVFRCYVTGNPTPTVTWYNSGRDITKFEKLKIEKIQGGYLVRYGKLHPKLHNGTISCRADNGVDPPVQDTASIRILWKMFNASDPSLPIGFPKPAGIFNRLIRVIVGRSVTFAVNVTGDPTPKITWFKNRRFVDWTNTRITLLPDRSLRIVNAQLTDAGEYDYLAENDKGMKFSRLWTFIPYVPQTKPVFRNVLQNMIVDPQTDVVLNCTAAGYPKPLIRWQGSSKNRAIMDDGLLRIKNIVHTETYKCVAENIRGRVSMAVKVTVRNIPLAPVSIVAKSRKPYFLTIAWKEGDPNRAIRSHIIKFRAKGERFWTTYHDYKGPLTTWTFTRLKPYTDYEVQVFSGNNLGTSKGSDVVTLRTGETVPGTAPHNIVVKATGSDRFEVSWEPPLYPHGIITSYRVYYTDTPHKEALRYWRLQFARQSPVIITGLIPNHRYAVMMQSATIMGSGPYSEKFLVQTVKGAPSDPQKVKVNVLSSTSVEVTWSKPLFDGGGQGIVGYVVHYNLSSSAFDKEVQVQSPDDYSKTISALTPFTTYQFAVTAKTDAGLGPISFSTFAATNEDVPSAAPGNLTCAKVDEFTVRCSWSPLSFRSRNGEITGYQLRYKTKYQNLHSWVDITGSNLSATVQSLQAYTMYHIDVAAKTSMGRGPFSRHVTVTTDETRPTKAPVDLKAEVLSSTEIYVTWKAPTPPFGAKLLGYAVYYRRYPEEPVLNVETTWGSKTNVQLTKLLPEKMYVVRVAVHSAKGSGKFTDPLYVKTKQAPPLPPVLRTKKLPESQVGVAVRWNSKARNIYKFRLRYTKEIEEITNHTLLQQLTYVEKNFSKEVTSYKLVNLEPGLWYLIKLSVQNGGGWSAERQAWIEMNPGKPTGAPLNFKVKPKSSTSVQLSWDLPSKWKRHGKILGYNITYRRADSTGRRNEIDLDSKKKMDLRGLSKFSTYLFSIRARTAAGVGPAAKVQGTTFQDAPSDSPKILEAKGRGTDVVLLKFAPPTSPNGPIVGYQARIYLSDPNDGAKYWSNEEINHDANEMYVGKLIKAKHRYWFEVAAKTIIGYGPFSAAVSAETLNVDFPLPVRSLSAGTSTSQAIQLSWDVPASTAAIRSYQVSYRGRKTFRGADNKLTTLIVDNTKMVKCCNESSAYLDGLEPYAHYEVNVSSIGESQESESRWINFTTKVGQSPPFLRPNISRNDITGDYIPIYLSRASEKNGPISHYLVYVANLGATLANARTNLEELIKTSSRPGRSRRAAKNDDEDDESIYVTAKLSAYFVPARFNVGDGKYVNGFINKPLTLGHFYSFFVECCVLNENSECLTTSSGFTDLVKFTEEQSARTSGSGNDTSDGKLWLLGPLVAVLLLVIVIVVIFFLWKRRVRVRNQKPKDLTKLVHEERLPMMTSPKDPVEMQRRNLETQGMREHPPIHISQLGYHIEELEANNSNLFTREYESIDPGMTFISDASSHHLNQSKNRYPNIVPYDHTRVVLQETNGFQDSDYINANFMAGYRKQNAYIATQAPLPNTITDFWQMIWEQDTRTIVMMTNLKEKGRIKCDQYWPNNQEKLANISVTVLETVELAHCTIRTFRLCKDSSSDKPRELKQFQYTAWPDHGVPHYSTSLLCFIRKVRLSNPSQAGPMVVHCSAGVGRTGVFIVIDSMLERIRREQTVDVYGHVTLLRSQRNHMVQTEDQYIFIHHTLLEAVLFGHTDIQASNLSQYYKKLNEMGETETTNIEEQFKQLSSLCPAHRYITAVLPVNKLKNRFPKILPYEHSRVDLVPVRGVDGSNYINASFIDGYKQRRAYIAAQGPLEDTVNDFWRMVMEKKSNIVVMLSGTDEKEMSAQYWPVEKSAKYHFYIVDPVSVEETPNFTLRQFKVNDMMSSCPSLIKLFQLRKWPERGKPQSCKEILDLIGQVHTARNNDESKGPVVVHCGSGSGRSGVFCTLSIVVERMRAEGLVDLLQTVRQLREQRPLMVETLEQYCFCYEAALQYLSSFDHIA